MNHVGTHPEILETERNGRPDGERNSVECPDCGRLTYTDNLRKCQKCGHELCPLCPDTVWIAEYDWHFCGKDEAQEYLVGQIQDADQKIFDIRQSVKIALQEIDFRNEASATARLRAVLEQTKG